MNYFSMDFDQRVPKFWTKLPHLPKNQKMKIFEWKWAKWRKKLKQKKLLGVFLTDIIGVKKSSHKKNFCCKINIFQKRHPNCIKVHSKSENRYFCIFFQFLLRGAFKSFYSSEKLGHLTIFVTWQSRVALDSIRNSCDISFHRIGSQEFLQPLSNVKYQISNVKRQTSNVKYQLQNV